MIKEYGSYLSALCAYTYSCRRLWAYSWSARNRIFDPFVFTSRWRSYTALSATPFLDDSGSWSAMVFTGLSSGRISCDGWSLEKYTTEGYIQWIFPDVVGNDRGFLYRWISGRGSGDAFLFGGRESTTSCSRPGQKEYQAFIGCPSWKSFGFTARERTVGFPRWGWGWRDDHGKTRRTDSARWIVTGRICSFRYLCLDWRESAPDYKSWWRGIGRNDRLWSGDKIESD